MLDINETDYESQQKIAEAEKIFKEKREKEMKAEQLKRLNREMNRHESLTGFYFLYFIITFIIAAPIVYFILRERLSTFTDSTALILKICGVIAAVAAAAVTVNEIKRDILKKKIAEESRRTGKLVLISSEKTTRSFSKGKDYTSYFLMLLIIWAFFFLTLYFFGVSDGNDKMRLLSFKDSLIYSGLFSTVVFIVVMIRSAR